MRNADILRDRYLDGLKRLVAISKANRATRSSEIVHADREIRKPPVNVCLVCAHMWDANMTKTGTEPKKCPSCSSTLWNSVGLRKHRCRQCTHVWLSRLEHPQTCPGCKSKLWDRDSMRFICGDCGHNQVQRRNSIPKKCGNCGSFDLFSEAVRCVCGNCGYTGTMAAKKQCPVCKMQSLIKKGETSIENKDSINPTALAILGSDIADTRKIIEIGNNTEINATDAEILVRFSNGEDPVSIARIMKVSLNKAIITVMPIRKDGGGIIV